MRAAAWQTGMCLPSFLPSMGAVYIEQVLRAYGAFQRSTYHTPSGQSRGLGAATHRSNLDHLEVLRHHLQVTDVAEMCMVERLALSGNGLIDFKPPCTVLQEFTVAIELRGQMVKR
jgi:hypothetical protein